MKKENSMKTDTELLNWLEEHQGCDLVSSDNGYWAVSCSGMQNVPFEKEPQDIDTCFIIFKDEWRPTVREAILKAIEDEKG